MWPILVGFALGVIVYFLGAWVGGQVGPLYRLVADATTARWLRILLIVLIIATSGVWLGVFFLVVHAWPPLSTAFDRHSMYDMFWLAFHGSRFPSACIGFALGLLATAWAAYATNQYAENIGLLGIALAVVAVVTIGAGVDSDFKFLSRLNKVSASVFSFELESARNLANKPTTTAPGSVAPGWSAFEPVNLALVQLKDLGSDIVRRDMVVTEFLSGTDKPGANDSGREAAIALLQANANFLAKAVGPFVVLRETIHSMKRDVSPAYFYTEKLELVRFAVSLRELVLLDVRTERLNDGLRQENERLRQEKVKEASAALVELIRHSRDKVCTFRLWRHPSIKLDDARSIETAASCNDIDRDLKGLAFPSRQAVRNAPYVAMMAALFLFGSGEREAAASILDHWRHQVQEELPAGTTPRTRGTYEKHLAAIHEMRVVMMMGTVLAERKNPVMMELATLYQWSAMKQLDTLTTAHPKLAAFKEKMQAAKTEPGLVTIASDMAANRKVTCPETPDIPREVASFVYGRATLLNNVTFYLTLQPAVLEVSGVADRLDAWMNSLNGLRPDCLLRVLGRDDHEVRRSVAAFVDTLAHGFLAQATLRKANAGRAKKALCKAYKAAFVANMLAGQPRQLNLSDHEPFLRASLKENGIAITDFRFKTATGDVLRAAREQLEVLGEGACSDFSPNTTESWTDDAG